MCEFTFNSNMGCIEIVFTSVFADEETPFNSNMGCIEMVLSLLVFLLLLSLTVTWDVLKYNR